mmetsp:Transcript_29590/g.96360  ORF Transcript_29590/g.96360 Transcript_29590/m.96360 type:complete len:165 (+) Transcript_29590:26-520(+)
MLRQAASQLRTRFPALPRAAVGAGVQSPALRDVFAQFYGTVPETHKYLKSHEYAVLEGDVATVGITDHAQSELGDVVYVELPEVGSTVTAQETFGVVESVKAASDVYSPISGEVVAINEDLVENPGKVNESPYEEGWFIKVKPSAPAEMDSLLDAAAYTAHCSD